VRNSLREIEGAESVRARTRRRCGCLACVGKPRGKRETRRRVGGGGCGGSAGDDREFRFMQTRTKNPWPSIFQRPSRARVALSQLHTRARARVPLPECRSRFRLFAPLSRPTPFRILAKAGRRRWRDSAGSTSDEGSNQVDSRMCLSSELRRSPRWNELPDFRPRTRDSDCNDCRGAASLTRRATLPVHSALRERPSRPRLSADSGFSFIFYHIFVCSRQRPSLPLRVSRSRPRATRPLERRSSRR